MSATFNHEAKGATAASDCLTAILNSSDQGEACGYVLRMLETLAGEDDISKGARGGAAVILVNVLECGLHAIASGEAL